MMKIIEINSGFPTIGVFYPGNLDLVGEDLPELVQSSRSQRYFIERTKSILISF
jgi:hypothetical protein